MNLVGKSSRLSENLNIGDTIEVTYDEPKWVMDNNSIDSLKLLDMQSFSKNQISMTDE